MLTEDVEDPTDGTVSRTPRSTGHEEEEIYWKGKTVESDSGVDWEVVDCRTYKELKRPAQDQGAQINATSNALKLKRKL